MKFNIEWVFNNCVGLLWKYRNLLQEKYCNSTQRMNILSYRKVLKIKHFYASDGDIKLKVL